MKLRLLNLYPDQMNIYADRGNILFLERRCAWRGIELEVSGCGADERFDPDSYDLIYIGGGQDRDQQAVARDLVVTKRDRMHAAHESGVTVLAVCGGYQLLGESYQLEAEVIEGLGLVDLKTVRGPGPRLTGPVAIEVELGGQPRIVAGFENHAGRTWLGTHATPLGRVIAGHGNNGRDGSEGVHQGNLIGTYLHGPLLPKNVWLADYLLCSALARQVGREVELEPLDDTLEEAAHRSALAAARAG